MAFNDSEKMKSKKDPDLHNVWNQSTADQGEDEVDDEGEHGGPSQKTNDLKLTTHTDS